MVDAFLDAAGVVLALATEERTLAQIQIKNPTAVEKITDAPAGLRPYTPLDSNCTDYHQRTSGDGTDISHYTLVAHLAAYKDKRYDNIDARTAELIDAGFTFDDQLFSLTWQAQMNWNRLRVSVLTGVFTALDFPRDIPTLDDNEYTLAGISAAGDFFGAYANRLEERLRSGRDLKQQIREATTKAEIDAIVDTRQEEDAPDDTVSAKRQELLTANYVDWKYEIVETSGGKILSIHRYTTDNGDGTYSGLVQDVTYNYTGNKLISIVTNTYDTQGELVATETETFYADGSTTIRKFS